MNNLSKQAKLRIGKGMKLSVKIYKGEKFYIAEIPELGVITQGKTREEAKKNLKEAMELQVSVMADYAIKHGSIRIERGHLVKVKE